MSEYFFNDVNAWGNNGIPLPGSDFTTPSNTTIKIDTNMLRLLGYSDIIVPNNSIIKFISDNIQLIAKTLQMNGTIELNTNSTILIAKSAVDNRAIYSFNNASIWPNDIPGSGSFTFPDDIIMEIDADMLHALGYSDVTVPKDTLIKFISDNIQFVSKTIQMNGVIELNTNSTILITNDGITRPIYSFNDSSIWPNGIPLAGEDCLFPENIIMEIGSNMLQQAGYDKITVPASTCVKFINANCNLYGKSVDIQGEIQLNINSTISVDTDAGLEIKYFHDAATWTDNKIPGIGEDITVGAGICLVISSQTTLAEYYGALTIPTNGMLLFDNTVDNTQLLVTSINNTGTLQSANNNIVKILRGNANLYLPVYLDSDVKVQDSQVGANSTMDSSSNFIMHCEQTKASTFGKYFKYKVDSNGNYTFKYNDTEKINFETELSADISNQKLYHYDRTFLNSSRKTTDATISNLLIQYISSIFFDRPDVKDLIKNPTDIRDNIVNTNIPGLIGLEITHGLNTNTYANGNNPLVSMFQQIKRQLPNRFSNDNNNVEYNFPFKSGDTIAIFVKMKANIFYNATSSTNGHTQELYNILRNNNNLPMVGGAVSHYNLLEFNDVNKTIKMKPTTWRIVLGLK